MPTSKDVTMRRFVLERKEDVSGTSGTGVVAEGVEFSNGWVNLHWISQLGSMEMCESIKVLMEIHGHEGRTVIKWID